METYKFTVTVEVEVEAFEWADALEVIEDYFGGGELGDLNITKSTIKHK